MEPDTRNEARKTCTRQDRCELSKTANNTNKAKGGLNLESESESRFGAGGFLYKILNRDELGRVRVHLPTPLYPLPIVSYRFE